METEVRIATTEDLRSIYEHEVSQNLPRRLNTHQLEHLDPDGAHVLIQREAFARHVAYSRGESYRVEILLKFTGEDLPYVVYIDVPVPDWTGLRTFREALDLSRVMSQDGDTD